MSARVTSDTSRTAVGALADALGAVRAEQDTLPILRLREPADIRARRQRLVFAALHIREAMILAAAPVATEDDDDAQAVQQ